MKYYALKQFVKKTAYPICVTVTEKLLRGIKTRFVSSLPFEADITRTNYNFDVLCTNRGNRDFYHSAFAIQKMISTHCSRSGLPI